MNVAYDFFLLEDFLVCMSAMNWILSHILRDFGGILNNGIFPL